MFNYPKEVKAFYMKENPDDPRTVLNNDCLAPEGYGEIIGGSQREDDYDKLLVRIHEQGLDPEAYGWYLDLRKYGTFVHSGFGLGLERTVAWICGIQHIREAIAFPAADPPAVPVAPVIRAVAPVIPSAARIFCASIGRWARRSLAALGMRLGLFTSSQSSSSTSSPAVIARRSRAPPPARSTASKRSRNLRLAASSAGPGWTPAFRARLTTANRQVSDLVRRAARTRGWPTFQLPLHLRQLLADLLDRPARASGQSNPTDAARSCSRYAMSSGGRVGTIPARVCPRAPAA